MSTIIETSSQFIADPQTPEWYEARRTHVGASEAAAALGLSKYRQPLQVYLSKIGEDPQDDADTLPMLHGRIFEPAMKDLFEEISGATLLDRHPPMMRHPRHEFLAATPDAEIAPGELLEIKVTNHRMRANWGDVGSDWIPSEYAIQAQMQMAVTGAHRVRVMVGFDFFQVAVYVVDRDDELIDLAEKGLCRFWECVTTRTPPPIDYSHASTIDLVKRLHGCVSDTTVDLSEESRAAWAEYEALGQQIKALSDKRDALKAQVLMEIGEHGAGFLGDGRMIRRKRVQRKGYVVEDSEFIDVRAVKAK